MDTGRLCNFQQWLPRGLATAVTTLPYRTVTNSSCILLPDCHGQGLEAYLTRVLVRSMPPNLPYMYAIVELPDHQREAIVTVRVLSLLATEGTLGGTDDCSVWLYLDGQNFEGKALDKPWSVLIALASVPLKATGGCHWSSGRRIDAETTACQRRRLLPPHRCRASLGSFLVRGTP